MDSKYSIKLNLCVKCTEDNLVKILERCLKKGFKFVKADEIKLEFLQSDDIETIAREIVAIQDAKISSGNLERGNILILNKYDQSNSCKITLCLSWAGYSGLDVDMDVCRVSNIKMCDIDFDYYTRMCLDLVKDLQIMEVKATID